MSEQDHGSPPPNAPRAARARTLLARAREFALAFRGRRLLSDLARLDDRMLHDIGLTRGDLSDAAAQGILRDPTRVLHRRVAERRGARRSQGESLPTL